MQFDGKRALITGGARGIGAAIATRLAANGARVAIADLDLDKGKQTAASIGENAIAVKLDVASPESWQAAKAEVDKAFGGLDILVNNAGIAGRSAPTWELSFDEWKQVLDIDLTGVFLGCQTFVSGMIDQGYGRIVNIASIAGKEGNPNAVPYSAAKSGVIGLTKALAKEVATKGILVNAITPAVIATEILAQVSEEHIKYMTSRIPMGRVGQPEEVAALAAFLSSDDLSFSTGAVLDLSGGRATYRPMSVACARTSLRRSGHDRRRHKRSAPSFDPVLATTGYDPARSRAHTLTGMGVRIEANNQRTHPDERRRGPDSRPNPNRRTRPPRHQRAHDRRANFQHPERSIDPAQPGIGRQGLPKRRAVNGENRLRRVAQKLGNQQEPRRHQTRMPRKWQQRFGRGSHDEQRRQRGQMPGTLVQAAGEQRPAQRGDPAHREDHAQRAGFEFQRIDHEEKIDGPGHAARDTSRAARLPAHKHTVIEHIAKSGDRFRQQTRFDRFVPFDRFGSPDARIAIREQKRYRFDQNGNGP